MTREQEIKMHGMTLEEANIIFQKKYPEGRMFLDASEAHVYVQFDGPAEKVFLRGNGNYPALLKNLGISL